MEVLFLRGKAGHLHCSIKLQETRHSHCVFLDLIKIFSYRLNVITDGNWILNFMINLLNQFQHGQVDLKCSSEVKQINLLICFCETGGPVRNRMTATYHAQTF